MNKLSFTTFCMGVLLLISSVSFAQDYPGQCTYLQITKSDECLSEHNDNPILVKKGIPYLDSQGIFHFHLPFELTTDIVHNYVAFKLWYFDKDASISGKWIQHSGSGTTTLGKGECLSPTGPPPDDGCTKITDPKKNFEPPLCPL